MGLINKVDMVCLSPVGYGVKLFFVACGIWCKAFFFYVMLLGCLFRSQIFYW